MVSPVAASLSPTQLEVDEVGDVDGGVAGQEPSGAQQLLSGFAQRLFQAAGHAQRRGRVKQAFLRLNLQRHGWRPDR